jgi:predicted deacetylase
MRKILIRFDDICPTMDFSLWSEVLDTLSQYNIKPLIGVIPKCQDEDLNLTTYNKNFWDHIIDLQSKGFGIAMHGYTHVFDSKSVGIVCNGNKSEFAGHPLEVQVEKIKNGKKILNDKGIFVDTFFAPAHSYDDNTLKALKINGFKYISDGKSSNPYIRHGIKCIPCRDAGVPRIFPWGYYTAVFHVHEWRRPEKAHEKVRFLKLCNKYHEDICPFSEFKEQRCDNYYYAKVDEYIFMFYDIHIRPSLSLIKKNIKNFLWRIFS